MNYSKIILSKDSITDFAKERNLLLEKATTDWVLFIDSDEEVTPELEKEISSLEPKKDGYLIKRQDFFLGKWLRFGETGNMKLLRLGKKGAGEWKRKVHEHWDIKNTGELKNSIFHRPHPSIKQFIDKINYYSDIDAKEFKNFSLLDVLIKPIGKFIQNYFLKLGFLDGYPGFVHAFMMSFQSLVVRVKQYDLLSTA